MLVRPARRRFPPSLLAVLGCLAALALAGCVEHEVLVKLAADGSGEIVETTVARGPMVEMLKAMEAEQGEDDTAEKRAEAEARAARLGEGVTFVSWEKLPDAEGLGERTVYRFSDVTKLSLDPAPDDGEGSGDGEREERLRFRFEEADGRKVLVAQFEDPDAGAAAAPLAGEGEGGTPAEPEGEADGSEEIEEMAEALGEGMLEMVKPFLQGFRMRVAVAVDGRIVATDAPRDGSEVTLLELDFDRILAQEGAWEKLSAMGEDASLAEAGRGLAGVDGVVIPTGEVRIEFSGR